MQRKDLASKVPIGIPQIKRWGVFAMHAVARSGHYELFDLLLFSGVYTRTTSGKGCTALNEAC
jgi:hypothetical protein